MLKDDDTWDSFSSMAQHLYPVGEPDTFVFLQLGMLEYRKWRDIAIQAFERLHAEYPQTSLMFEWLPNVLLEAMAMWKVVVWSDLWGIQEAIKDGQTWFLLIPGDGDKLYSSMKMLVQNDATYTTLATQWQQYVFEHFDEQKQFVSFLSLFEKLLS